MQNKESLINNENDNNIAKKWLIGVSGTNMDDVLIHSFTGTVQEVKHHLVILVSIDRNRNRCTWSYGTVKDEDVGIKEDGRLYAFGSYIDFHNDYTAMLAEMVDEY